MEDLVKAPLNQAHLLDRAAEIHTKKHLYEKAIECREKAIENLLLTKALPLSATATKSLDLQISFHKYNINILKEQKRIKEEKLAAAALEAEQARSQSAKALFNTTETEEPTDQTDAPMENQENDIESLIRFEISKGDKLLESLASQHSSSSQSYTPDQLRTMITSAVKLPKSHDQVVEELRESNLQLKNLTADLFKENDKLKKENLELKRIIEEMKKEKKQETVSVSVPVWTKEEGETADTKLGSEIELPPLEPFQIPQLISSIKPRIKKSSMSPKYRTTSE